MKRIEFLSMLIVTAAFSSALMGPANDVLELTAQLCHFSGPIGSCSCSETTGENKPIFQHG